MIAYDSSAELEHLYPATYEGVAVGDKVTIARDLADDVKAGNAATVTALDSHPVFPVTVTIHKPAGQDIAGLPVRLDEISL